MESAFLHSRQIIDTRSKFSHKVFSRFSALLNQVELFLATYGVESNSSTLQRLFNKGKHTIREVTVCYLNQQLESALGAGSVLEGSTEELVQRFEGIDQFLERSGDRGLLLWVLKSVNRDDFYCLARALLKESRLTTLTFRLQRERFSYLADMRDTFDLTLAKKPYKMVKCWGATDGSLYWCVQDEHGQQIFVPYVYQHPFAVVRKAMKSENRLRLC